VLTSLTTKCSAEIEARRFGREPPTKQILELGFDNARESIRASMTSTMRRLSLVPAASSGSGDGNGDDNEGGGDNGGDGGNGGGGCGDVSGKGVGTNNYAADMEAEGARQRFSNSMKTAVNPLAKNPLSLHTEKSFHTHVELTTPPSTNPNWKKENEEEHRQ
jgi:hypothetical protein